MREREISILRQNKEGVRWEDIFLSVKKMDVEKKLKELKIELSAGPSPMANYVSVQKAGTLWFFSGAGPLKDGKATVTGRLGENLTTEQGYAAAREAGIVLLASLKRELNGDWERLEQIVKVQGFVSSTNDYYEQPKGGEDRESEGVRIACFTFAEMIAGLEKIRLEEYLSMVSE